jgi:hypothetical protein
MVKYKKIENFLDRSVKTNGVFDEVQRTVSEVRSSPLMRNVKFLLSSSGGSDI